MVFEEFTRSKQETLTSKKCILAKIASLVLVLSLTFLQEGINTYVSFQFLAIFFLGAMVLYAGVRVRKKYLYVFTFFVFSAFLATTAIQDPLVIVRNPSSPLFAVLAIWCVSAAIYFLPLIRVVRGEQLLTSIQIVSSVVVLLLVSILIVSETSILPYLSRESLTMQNSRLIDNYTDLDAILGHQAFLLLVGGENRIDLFYGEPSFLAIVLFTTAGSYILTTRLLAVCHLDSRNINEIPRRILAFAPLAAVLALLYVQSLSAVIYALILMYFILINREVNNRNIVRSLVIFAPFFAAAFAEFGYDYLVYRLGMEESGSFNQRFGAFSDLSLNQWITGVRDLAALPEVGIQNGIHYIVVVAGAGGVLYLLAFFRYVYRLAKPTGLASLSVLLLLAIASQNGGVFAPSKLVLFSFVILPLTALSMQSRSEAYSRVTKYEYA